MSLPAAAQLAAIARLVNANDLDGAANACYTLLQLAPSAAQQAPARVWLGVIAMRRGSNTEALAHFDAAYPFEKHNAPLLHQMGLVHFRLHHLERAEHFYRATLRAEPKFAAAHYNLGNLLQSKRDLVGAKRAFEAALTHAPTLAVAHTNLANTLVALGETAAALTRYEQALTQDDAIAEAHHGLALLLQKQNMTTRAEQHFRRALALAPRSVDVSLDFAEFLFGSERKAAAIACVEEALAHDATHEIATFKLAQYRGDALATMPRSVVEKLYAGMAGTFDEHLVDRLGYRIPELLMTKLAGWLQTFDGKADVLDLGCGTGLFGGLVRTHAKQLVGVDLSVDMLARAMERKIYDALMHADAVSHLATSAQTHDLIVATDVLIYVAPLPPLFEAAAKRLNSGGRFAFSTETPATMNGDFALQRSGRYAHSEAYIERLACAAGLLVLEKISTVIRAEKGIPVAGFMFVLGSD